MRYVRNLIFLVTIIAATLACAGEGSRGDFIYASGTDLMLHNKPFRYVGTNTYYLMVYSASIELRTHVDEIFKETKKMGISVIRTWAFNDGANQRNALQTEPGVYNENTFVGLDYVIAKAKRFGIYLILTFGNNWDNYGGVQQYIDWSPTTTKKARKEFFTDEYTKRYYKDHIKAVLTRKNSITGVRYKDDPTILAWELMNEPRVEGDQSGDILNDWIKEMSAYVKSIDKNHLVTTGCEGFYADVDKCDWKLNGSEGGDFIRNHSMDTVDIASFHLWPGASGYCMTEEGIRDWIKIHAEDAKKIGKPLILGEYGEPRGYNGDTAARDRLYQFILDMAREKKMAGTNFWILLSEAYRQYDDGYGVYYPEDRSTIRVIKSAAANME